jgi:hypothetical protein
MVECSAIESDTADCNVDMKQKTERERETVCEDKGFEKSVNETLIAGRRP